MPNERLTLRPFQAQDFPAYRAWYADDRLNRHLGPMDDDWLDHVLSDVRGEQWALLSGGELRAVIGLVPEDRPEAPAGSWLVTDLAVAPSLRRQGWGRRAWQSLTALPRMQARRWHAIVAQDNPQALAFFQAMGFRITRQPQAEDPFWLLAG